MAKKVRSEKVRSQKQAEEYWTQPEDGIHFVRHDLSEAEVEAGKARIRAGESIESVVDDAYDQITGKVKK